MVWIKKINDFVAPSRHACAERLWCFCRNCCEVQAITDIIIGFLGRKRNIVRNVSVFRERRGGEWCLGAFHMKRWHYVLFGDFSQKTIEVFKTCWSLLYSAILRSRADSLLSHVILHERLAFYSAFLNSANVVYLQRCTWNLSNGRIQSSKHGDLFFLHLWHQTQISTEHSIHCTFVTCSQYRLSRVWWKDSRIIFLDISIHKKQ